MASIINLTASGALLFTAINGFYPWKLHFQRDDKWLLSSTRARIDAKVQELAKKLGIDKPIEVIEKEGMIQIAQAQGIEWFSGRAGIAINPEIFSLMPDAQVEFVLAHELSHIKTNDMLWMGVVTGIVGVITTLAVNPFIPKLAARILRKPVELYKISSPAVIIGLSVSTMALFLFSRWREECADKRAISVCSDAAKKGAAKFFKELRECNIECRNEEEDSFLSALLKKLLYSREGDVRFDLLHPSLTARVAYLKAAS